MKTRSNHLIFYAPLPHNIPLDKIGGAEVGCQKTLQIYEKAGFKVSLLQKPAMSKGKLSYFIGMLKLPFQLFCLLFKNSKSPIHIVGFYRDVVFFEWLMMSAAKKLNHHVIYELRNGSMIDSYKKGSKLYQHLLKDLLINADIVLCQGQEYVDFIKEKWGIERTYYPNYIMDNFISVNSINRKRSPLKLIYFGRITKAKNVCLLIDVLNNLINEGYDANLELIGASDETYLQLIENKIEDYKLKDHVTLFGRQNFEFIAQHLETSHYFVFPSEEIQEGHSNSLTEAMGFGVVPIVSPVGFNASICGTKDLVVNSIDANFFSNKIIEIEKNNQWEKFSNDVYERVLSNYTQSIVGERLIKTINLLDDENE
jgi:glycosyltransferase involved in cell wall biosynthesis